MKRFSLVLLSLISLSFANDDIMVFSHRPFNTGIDTLYIRISDIDSMRFNNLPLTGLLANYPLNVMASGTGKDISGNKYSAIIKYGTASGSYGAADRFGVMYKSLYLFSDSSQFVRLPNVINNQSAFTVSLWFRADSINPWRWIFGQYPTPIAGGVNVGASLNNNNLRYHMTTTTDGLKTFDGTVTVTPDKWHNLTYTFSGTSVTTYLDTVADGFTYISGTAVSPDSLALGAGSFNGNKEMYRGSIDDVRIYNRSLTYTEIIALFKEGGYKPPK